jgi:Transposase DDE domain group 1
MLSCQNYYQLPAPHPGRHAAEPCHTPGSRNVARQAQDGWRSIRCAKDTGLRNLPLHGFTQNQIWCEIVALACELLAWMQMLAFTGRARRWEPRRLRLRLFSAAGRIVRGSRRLRLRLAASWPWAREITTAITRLQVLPPG